MINRPLSGGADLITPESLGAALADDDDLVRLDPRVVRAIQTLMAQYTDPELSLGVLASDMNLSRSRASRLLRLHCGVSFPHVLNSLRVNQAAAMLDRSSLSIKEIAGAVGYARTNELIRNFRRHFAVTPLCYRRRKDLAAQLARKKR